MNRQEYKKEWQRKNRIAFVSRMGFSTSADYGVGKKREFILNRDNYSCVKCGMTDSEHKEKWHRPITIDHKDKNRKNNSDDNLQTLCLSCHGSKDILPRLKTEKGSIYKNEIMNLRVSGKTYQYIADNLSLSIATVFKWVKKWEEA